MFGGSPVANPLSYKSTKYPTMEDRMKVLLQNREEALAAHELARSRIAEQRKSTFIPFRKGDQVWLDSRNLKTIYHKEKDHFQLLKYWDQLPTDCNFRRLGESIMSSMQRSYDHTRKMRSMGGTL